MYCTGVLLIGSLLIALVIEVTTMEVGTRPPKGPLGTLPGLEISGIVDDPISIVVAVVTIEVEMTKSKSDPELGTMSGGSAVHNLLSVSVGITSVNWSLVVLRPAMVASSVIKAALLWGRMNGVAFALRLLDVAS